MDIGREAQDSTDHGFVDDGVSIVVPSLANTSNQQYYDDGYHYDEPFNENIPDLDEPANELTSGRRTNQAETADPPSTSVADPGMVSAVILRGSLRCGRCKQLNLSECGVPSRRTTKKQSCLRCQNGKKSCVISDEGRTSVEGDVPTLISVTSFTSRIRPLGRSKSRSRTATSKFT